MEYKKLSDLCEINAGGTPSRTKEEYWENGNIPWLKIGNLNSKYIKNYDEVITELGLKNSSAKLFTKGTILYTIFATIGEVGILTIDASTNQAIAGIKLKDNYLIENEYLYYYLLSLKNKMKNESRGVAQNNINLTILRNIDVPIREKTEQLKIINILSKIEKLIEVKKQQIDKLNELIKAQFVEMFGEPFKNEHNYEFITFDNFMERCVDIGSNGANSVISEHLNMKDEEDYAMLIRTINFTANDFVNNMKYIDEESYNFFSKSKVYGGEIVFNKIGSAGINFIVPNFNRPVSLGLNQIMVTPKNINTRYLYELLNTEYGKWQINSRVKGAVTKSIQKTELKRIPILYPPIELQNKFAKIVEQIDKQKSEFEKSLKELEEMQAALMQEYFG